MTITNVLFHFICFKFDENNFMYRKIIDVVNEENLFIQLPKEYLNKQIEVIAFEVENTNEKVDKKKFNDAMAFFDTLNVDMSNFKFDRDEANER